MSRDPRRAVRRSRQAGLTAVAPLLVALSLSCREWSHEPLEPPAERIQPSSLLIWRNPNVPAVTAPVVDSFRVYLVEPHVAHVVHALDRSTGAIAWKRALTFARPPGSLAGYGLVLAGGRLVVGDVEIWGLDPASGSIVWHYAEPSAGMGVPSGLTLASDGSTIYSASRGFVYGVDARTGTERFVTSVWTADRVGLYTPVYSGGSIFAGVSAILDPNTPAARVDGGVVSVNASTGELQWARALPRTSDVEMSVFRIAVSESHVIAPSTDGNVYVLDRSTGALARTLPRSLFVTTVPSTPQLENYNVATAPGLVFISEHQGRITALDSRSFERRWSTHFRAGTVTEFGADDLYLYAAHFNGVLGVARLDDGAVHWYVGARDLRPDGEEGIISAPAVSGDTVFIGGVLEAYALRRR